MRDWLAHAYFGIDPEVLWDVIEKKVPQLVDALQTLQGDELGDR